MVGKDLEKTVRLDIYKSLVIFSHHVIVWGRGCTRVARSKYSGGQYETAFDFINGIYASKGVETIVDVWCEPEVFMQGTWKELVDGKWEGIQY